MSAFSPTAPSTEPRIVRSLVIWQLLQGFYERVEPMLRPDLSEPSAIASRAALAASFAETE
jgi:hypothetical protein